MSWVKKKCFVVTAFYRDGLYQENETPINEELICKNESDALKAKSEFKKNDDFSEIFVVEEDHEIWI